MIKKIIIGLVLIHTSGYTQAVDNLIYKYKDKNGKTIYADKVPPQEKGQIVVLSSKSGTIKKIVEQELTEKEVIVRNEKVAEEKRIIENNALQRKKDISLLNSYSNVEEIEKMKKYELDQIDQGIKNNIENIANLKEKINILNINKEKSPNNKTIQNEYDKTLEQLKTVEQTLENNKSMYHQRENKYIDDKNRYLEILKEMTVGNNAAQK